MWHKHTPLVLLEAASTRRRLAMQLFGGSSDVRLALGLGLVGLGGHPLMRSSTSGVIVLGCRHIGVLGVLLTRHVLT